MSPPCSIHRAVYCFETSGITHSTAWSGPCTIRCVLCLFDETLDTAADSSSRPGWCLPRALFYLYAGRYGLLPRQDVVTRPVSWTRGDAARPEADWVALQAMPNGSCAGVFCWHGLRSRTGFSPIKSTVSAVLMHDRSLRAAEIDLMRLNAGSSR